MHRIHAETNNRPLEKPGYLGHTAVTAHNHYQETLILLPTAQPPSPLPSYRVKISFFAYNKENSVKKYCTDVNKYP